MTLDYLLYASRLNAPLSHEALKELLEVSKRNNAQNGLTGFLQIEGRIVLQYLEGPREQLLLTLQRIRKDNRHSDLTVLTEGVIEQRFFEGWQMALVESTTLSLFDLIGAPCDDIPDVTGVNPMDLITLLSANASYLREWPSALAS